jgi:hypothetical protein
LEAHLAAAPAYAVRDCHERIAAARVLTALRRDMAATISRTEARQSMDEVVRRVGARLHRLVRDMPAHLAGLDESMIHERLHQAAVAALQEMSRADFFR